MEKCPNCGKNDYGPGPNYDNLRWIGCYSCGYGFKVELPKVIGAPQWLKDRMKRLREMPPPTLEEVRQQWAASADHEYRHRYDDIWSIDSQGRKVIR